MIQVRNMLRFSNQRSAEVRHCQGIERCGFSAMINCGQPLITSRSLELVSIFKY